MASRVIEIKKETMGKGKEKLFQFRRFQHSSMLGMRAFDLCREIGKRIAPLFAQRQRRAQVFGHVEGR
jgi:hypothetical protein